MTYSGFFVRDNLGQQPGQTGTTWSNSPDVIALDNAPASLATFIDANGYNVDPNQNPVLNTPSYVYVRALNTNAAATAANPVTGRAWFYWVESNLILWPQNWRGDSVMVEGSGINYQPITATGTAAPTEPGVLGNPVCLTDQPFVWTPPSLITAGTQYSMITWIENQPSEPPQSPTSSLGYIGTFDQLVAFVLANPNMGWRSTTDVASAGPSWSQTTQVSGPPQPQQFYIGVQCHNMPTDGQVGFDMPPPGPAGSGASLPMTSIRMPNMQFATLVSDWPANATSSITVNYQQGATVPPPGSSINVVMFVVADTLSRETLAAVRAAPASGPTMLTMAATAPDVKPEEVIMIGSVSFSF